MESKHRQFALLAVLLAGSRAADLLTTYWITPDLVHELNPVVRAGGMGWGALIAFQIVLVVAVTLLLYIDLLGFPRFRPERADLNFREFVAMWYMGRPWPAWKCLSAYSIARTRRAWMRLMGSILAQILVVIGFWAATQNMFIEVWPAAASVLGMKLAGVRIVYWTLMFLVIAVGIPAHYRSLRGEYLSYRNRVDNDRTATPTVTPESTPADPLGAGSHD